MLRAVYTPDLLKASAPTRALSVKLSKYTPIRFVWFC